MLYLTPGLQKVLMPKAVLRHSAAISVGAGLYPSFGFAPTRLNTADDPTRDAVIRAASRFSCLTGLDFSQIQGLHATQLSRAAAGWLRLLLLATILVPSQGCHAYDTSMLWTSARFWSSLSFWICSAFAHFWSSLSIWTCSSVCLAVLLCIFSLSLFGLCPPVGYSNG